MISGARSPGGRWALKQKLGNHPLPCALTEANILFISSPLTRNIAVNYENVTAMVSRNRSESTYSGKRINWDLRIVTSTEIAVGEHICLA